jgi:hypothetical protein
MYVARRIGSGLGKPGPDFFCEDYADGRAETAREHDRQAQQRPSNHDGDRAERVGPRLANV